MRMTLLLLVSLLALAGCNPNPNGPTAPKPTAVTSTPAAPLQDPGQPPPKAGRGAAAKPFRPNASFDN